MQIAALEAPHEGSYTSVKYFTWVERAKASCMLKDRREGSTLVMVHTKIAIGGCKTAYIPGKLPRYGLVLL